MRLPAEVFRTIVTKALIDPFLPGAIFADGNILFAVPPPTVWLLSGIGHWFGVYSHDDFQSVVTGHQDGF